GLFSTTTGWPQRSDRCCPISRPEMSSGPPGGKGTTRCTGFEGYCWADAAAAKAAKSRATMRFIGGGSSVGLIILGKLRTDGAALKVGVRDAVVAFDSGRSPHGSFPLARARAALVSRARRDGRGADAARYPRARARRRGPVQHAVRRGRGRGARRRLRAC